MMIRMNRLDSVRSDLFGSRSFVRVLFFSRLPGSTLDFSWDSAFWVNTAVAWRGARQLRFVAKRRDPYVPRHL